MKALFNLAVLGLVGLSYMGACAAEPIFHHTFSTVKDESGTYTGVLGDGATLKTVNGVSVVDLGDNGYFDFGASVGSLIASLSGDYTISTNVFIPSTTTLGAAGNFILSFANSSDKGYLFFGANESRYSITTTNWNGEQTVRVDTQFPKGEWVNLTIVQSGSNNTVYFNGVSKKSGSITLHPDALGATSLNWLGRSPYSGDVKLKGAQYSDFQLFNVALTADEVKAIGENEDLTKLNELAVANSIAEAIGSFNYDFSALRSDVTLHTSYAGGIAGVWTSSNPAAVSAEGKVTRPAAGQPNAELTLTLSASKAGVTKVFEFPATVIAEMTAKDAAQFDLDNIVLQPNKDNLRNSIFLPGMTPEGSVITWKSNNEEFLSSEGKVRKLSEGDKKQEVILTASAEKDGVTATKDFTVHIALKEDYDSYLFLFFPNNNNENIYYALSTDGYNYKVINNDKRVLAADSVSIKKGLRDPHVLRGEDGNFYMVATDMKSSEGWSSNRGMVLFKSPDLINWQHSTVHFPDRFPEWKNVTRVWAPEVIWDANYENTDGSKGRYLIYYSLLTNDGKCPYDKVYYSYANDDFTDITEPKYFYDRGSATIDCDIVFNPADNLYHMVYKNEGSGGICKVTAERLTPEPGQPEGSQWKNPSGFLQQTNEAVEGAGIFRLINSDTWVLMYDCYANGHYQFCSSEDLETFRLMAQTTTSGAFTPRHGTVIPLHPEETAALLKAFPANLGTPTITGANSPEVRKDNVKIQSNTVYVPVMPGTDLKAYDPMLMASVSATVSPEGPQDFSDGKAVTYTVTRGDASATYTVTAAVEGNPVLPGFTADPEVLYSHKTGKFYIYPTSDGISGWGGHTFNVYSSSDLLNWHKENCILDLATNDVTWATGNAWAPCIEEKLCDDGKYRYYFYFSGHNPDKNYKTLGCAVSESPVGPFRDLGKPMIDTNIASGQLIDSDVFTDPVSGNTYFYWGNGSLVASKLNADMTSVTDAKAITPSGGSLQTYAFREGVYVFYREGKYYFLWSVDDTGAKNYHVAYGTSDSPMGPIKVADSPIVIKQDASQQIYGTGHNSIVQIPGRDEWYIVYHRINKAFVNNGPGYHREVCIDKLEFNADGTIKPVTPTHKGIDPVDPDNSGVADTMVDDLDATVVSTHYFDISGISLGTAAPTAPGVYVKVDILSNGRSRASKVTK